MGEDTLLDNGKNTVNRFVAHQVGVTLAYFDSGVPNVNTQRTKNRLGFYHNLLENQWLPNERFMLNLDAF